MATTPASAVDPATAAVPVAGSAAGAETEPEMEPDLEPEPMGEVRLRLRTLGIDHRGADFPARFVEFCAQNDLYEMEVSAAGELVILPMAGYRDNRRESYFTHFLIGWEMVNGGFASSQTGRFRLPTGEIRGADAAWMSQERYDAQSPEQRRTVIEGAPDFVVEIRSGSDDRSDGDDTLPLRDRMEEWMAGGCRLGWLIDAGKRRVFIYRAGQGEPEVREDPEMLDGEDVLSGFAFPVGRYIFDLE